MMMMMMMMVVVVVVVVVGGDDDDDDDNDNDDNYDDDDDAFFRDLKVASRTFRTALLALQVSAEQSVGWMTAVIDKFGLLYSDRAKTLTDDFSALYWTQELGLTCLESGRRAASNEPSCFSRR